ncbi:MAG: hypothetical protein QM564_06750 [Bergeyella sp.]
MSGSINANSATLRDDITIIAKGKECSERLEKYRQQIEKEGGSVDNISNNCILYIDQEGKVHVTASLDERLNDTTNSDVFKRNASNPSDSYFARENGEPSTVNSNNFLRIGATELNNTTASK